MIKSPTKQKMLIDPERLQSRMRELDNMSQADLSARTGLHRGVISNIVRGIATGHNTNTLYSIAEVLDVDVDWLVKRSDEVGRYKGVKTSAAPRDLRSIPVVGTVEAGAFRPVPDHIDESSMRRVDVARHWRFARFNHFAFDVSGDSMNAAGIGNGDVIICIGWVESGMRELTGLTVVVERAINGGHLREWTVKEMEVLSDRIVLHPRSTNQAHKPIEILRDHTADDGTEVRIIALVVNVLKNVFPF